MAEIFMEFIESEIPNFFTPDGECAKTDFWDLKNQDRLSPKNTKTIIFDRYGREVYRMGLMTNGWDGLITIIPNFTTGD